MTLKIDTVSDGTMTTLRLSGRIDVEHLEELKAQLRRHGPRVAIDLDDVTLVDLAAVRFLLAREAEGVELRNCAPYIREWMDRNRTGREARGRREGIPDERRNDGHDEW